MSRNRVVWWLEIDAAEEAEADEHVYMTKGWLEESDILRWALSRALQHEGTHNGWHSANAAAEAAVFDWAYDDDGNAVTITCIPLESVS